MIGVPVQAHGEETLDFVAPGEESTIKWYLNDEAFDRIRSGMVCPNCLEPFPARLGVANTSAWREHAHLYSKIRTKDELLTLVAQERCPVCSTEVSHEMLNLTHRGADPFDPTLNGSYS